MTSRYALIGIALMSAMLLDACGGRRDLPSATALPELYPAPAFQCTNFDGRPVGSETLSGTVWIAYFFFSSCAGPCPVMNSTANVLQAEFAGAADFRIVGFTVDPENDTRERLAGYAARYAARPDRWYMLRTSLDDVAALATNGFRMGDLDTPAMHSTRFALVDRNGMIRGYYDGMDVARVDELRTAITTLLKEDA